MPGARRGAAPTLMEAKTYRRAAPSSADDDRRYREREEIEAWRLKDPIARFERYLLENAVIDEAERDEIDEAVKAEVREASDYAESAPAAEPEEGFSGVYAGV